MGRSAALPRRRDGGLLLALHRGGGRPCGDRHVRRQPLARAASAGRSSGSPRIPAGSSAGRRCRTRGPTAPATACAPARRSRPERDHVRLDLGPDCRVEAALAAPVAWPRRVFGGLGGAHAIPGLSQYWHPHVFAAGVRGRRGRGPEAFALDDAGAYAEKNWGGGFPDRWWWGQAHDFGDRCRSPSPAARSGRPGAAGRHGGRRAARRRVPLPPAGPVEIGAAAGACAPAPARTASRSRALPIRHRPRADRARAGRAARGRPLAAPLAGALRVRVPGAADGLRGRIALAGREPAVREVAATMHDRRQSTRLS